MSDQQQREARIRERQQACPHEHIAQEVLWGQRSGDYECLDCGKVFMPEAYRRLREEGKRTETMTAARDTDYATMLGHVAKAYPGGHEIRLERLRIKATGEDEIRLSWWKDGHFQPRPADLPVADFLDLIKEATLAGLLSAPRPLTSAP